VARRGGEELLIPVIPDAIRNVDVRGGTVTVADWLLEPDEDDASPPPLPSPSSGEGVEA
jgi:hypothetical protein